MGITFKSALLMAGILASANLLSANEMRDASGRVLSVQEKVDMLRRELNLTPGQSANIKSILEEQKAKMEAATSAAEHKAIKEETRTRIRALLSAEQQAKYDRLKANWEKRKSDKKPGSAVPVQPSTGTGTGFGTESEPAPSETEPSGPGSGMDSESTPAPGSVQ